MPWAIPSNGTTAGNTLSRQAHRQYLGITIFILVDFYFESLFRHDRQWFAGRQELLGFRSGFSLWFASCAVVFLLTNMSEPRGGVSSRAVRRCSCNKGGFSSRMSSSWAFALILSPRKSPIGLDPLDVQLFTSSFCLLVPLTISHFSCQASKNCGNATLRRLTSVRFWAYAISLEVDVPTGLRLQSLWHSFYCFYCKMVYLLPWPFCHVGLLSLLFRLCG